MWRDCWYHAQPGKALTKIGGRFDRLAQLVQDSHGTNGVAIQVNELSYKYFQAENFALRNINLSVKKGEFVGFLGPSMAGKSTLCYALTGLIPHDVVGELYGSVLINGIDTISAPVYELSKNYGFVFDNPEYQLSQATVEEEIALGLENRGVDPESMREIVAEVQRVVGLSGYGTRSPFELSGGQQQRLAIATMLVSKPSILILDEPTSFLDPQGKEEVYAALKSLNDDGLTIVLVDHEVELMANAVDRIFVMNKGEIVTSGTPQDVFKQVRRMDQIGLRVPQSTELVVKTLGSSDRVPLTVDEAMNVLLPKLEKKVGR
jgi:energy-coupling factor transport system ATP-binding protein